LGSDIRTAIWQRSVLFVDSLGLKDWGALASSGTLYVARFARGDRAEIAAKSEAAILTRKRIVDGTIVLALLG
jgi:hypothetical protein